MRNFFKRELISNDGSNLTWTTYPIVQIKQAGLFGCAKFRLLLCAAVDKKSRLFLYNKTQCNLTTFFSRLFFRTFQGYLITLILNSLTYISKKKRHNYMILDLHYTKEVVFTIPKGVITRVLKRRVSVYGVPEVAIPFAHYLISFRPYDNYTGYGVRALNRGNRKKQGKVRIR